MFIVILFLWFVFNGKFTVEILAFGIIISLAVCFFLNRFAGYSFKQEFRRIPIVPQLFVYFLVLIKEIVLANFAVMKMVYKGQESVEPAFVHFKTDLKTDFAKVLFANSITLTPGTITVSLHQDEYYVHCLDKSLGEGIENSCFYKRLKKMEERL